MEVEEMGGQRGRASGPGGAVARAQGWSKA